SSIQDPDGNPLVVDAVESWSKAPGKVRLSRSSATLAEAGGSVTVTAAIANVQDTNVTIALAFNGTATLGVDYTPSATQLPIPAGQTQASLTLTALQDTRDEDDEWVVVDIASVTGATEDGLQQAITSLVDDDPPPSLSIGNASVLEGNTGARPLQFVVQLSAASG